MKVELKQKPKSPTIIEGFPGFGLVGTISTEFLIKHLNAVKIGRMTSNDMIPLAAVHDMKVVEPIGIFYDKKNNLVIIHAMSPVKGLEWKIAAAIGKLARDLNAKEIISIEAIGSMQKSDGKPKTFYFSENKKIKNINLLPLKEGMVMGVTGALMVNNPELISALFVESHVSVGDSKAAAKIIEVLDNYLGLKVDYKPLLKSAADFEKTLKGILSKGKQAQIQSNKRDMMNYLG